MGDEPFAPHRTSNQVHEVDLTGYFIPWFADQILVMRMRSRQMTGTRDLFIPVFSTVEKLTIHLKSLKIDFHDVKQITDMWTFLDSVPLRLGGERLRIVIDPWINEAGNTRFRELTRTPIEHIPHA